MTPLYKLGDLRPSVFRVLSPLGDGVGTGFVCHPQGWAMTCWHVLESWQAEGLIQGQVQMGDQVIEASWIQALSLQPADLAVMRLSRPLGDPAPWSFLPLDGRWHVQIGDSMHSFGYPAGAFERSGISIAPQLQGLTPSRVDEIEVFPIAGFNLDEIQGGYSGAPVVSGSTQRVIGLVHAKRHETEAFIVPLKPLFDASAEWRDLHESLEPPAPALSDAQRQALPPRIQALLAAGSPYIDLAEDAQEPSVQGVSAARMSGPELIVCELRMRQAKGLFVFRAPRTMSVGDAARQLAAATVPGLHERRYEWTLNFEEQDLPPYQTFASAGIDSGLPVYLVGLKEEVRPAKLG